MPDIEFLAADLADATAALPAAAALFVKTGRAVRSHAGPIGAGEGAYAPRGAVVTADAGSVVWIWLVGRGLPAELQGLRVGNYPGPCAGPVWLIPSWHGSERA